MNLKELKHKAISLLAIKDYTSLEMMNKLSKVGLEEDVEEVITFLIQKDLINDVLYGNNYYEYQLNQGHGYVWIKNKLLQKGLSPQFVEQLKEEYEQVERLACLDYAHKLEGQRSNKSYSALKQSLELKLKLRGFSSSMIYETMSSLVLKEDDDALSIEFHKALRKYSKEVDDRIRNNKIIQFLQRKGYRYEDIIKMIRSEEDGSN